MQLTLPENDYLFSTVPRMHLVFFGLGLAVISGILASWQLNEMGLDSTRAHVLLTGVSCCMVASIFFILNARRVGGHLLCSAALVTVVGIALIDQGFTNATIVALPFIGMLAIFFLGWQTALVYFFASVLGAIGVTSGSGFQLADVVPAAGGICFAFFVGIVYERNRLQVQNDLFRLAAFHPLTNLPGRAFWDVVVQQTHARHKRRGENYGVIFLDVDGLKKVNDELGHAAGDALLVEVANRLSALTRTEERPFHLCGDEYVVLIENADLDGISLIETRLEEISGHSFDFNGITIDVSVSLGSAVGGRDSDPDEVLKIADRSMYARKRKKRDLKLAA